MSPFAQRRVCFVAGRLALFALMLLGTSVARAASPPKVTVDNALSGGLVRGRWQPLLVTLANGPDGQGIARGEVQVIVEDANVLGRVLSTASRTVSLPGGPGVAQTIVYVRVPDGVVPSVFVQVADRASGETLTRKRMDKLPVAPDQLTVVAASDLPDALAYLRSETLGVIVEDGVLRPYDDPTNGNANNRNRFGSAFQPADKVVPLNPITLPDRAAGYDGVAAVYLGDIAPDTLSNAQVAALQTWTSSGGLLVCGGPRLQTDERFRAWLPVRWGAPGGGVPLSGPDPLARRYQTPRSQIAYTPLTAVPGRNARAFLGDGTNGVALAAPVGRGTFVALGFDPAATAFADWPARNDLWRDVALQGVTTPAVIAAALNDPGTRWNGSGTTFSQSVLRAPGLRAPGFGAIGAFLLAYLVLLVPVNYAVLKRLDRRELTWLTVPVLVLLFSLSAYGFGYRLKGGQIRMNTASLVEMASGDGRATVYPARAFFRRDAPVTTCRSRATRRCFSIPPVRASAGQAAEGKRTTRRSPCRRSRAKAAQPHGRFDVGDARAERPHDDPTGPGVDARFRVEGNDLVGNVTNQTGRTLDDVTVLMAGQKQSAGMLRNGEGKAVRLATRCRFCTTAPATVPGRVAKLVERGKPGQRARSKPHARRSSPHGSRRRHASMTNREQLPPGVRKRWRRERGGPVLVTAGVTTRFCRFAWTATASATATTSAC
jgi:hypothetical protein